MKTGTFHALKTTNLLAELFWGKKGMERSCISGDKALYLRHFSQLQVNLFLHSTYWLTIVSHMAHRCQPHGSQLSATWLSPIDKKLLLILNLFTSDVFYIRMYIFCKWSSLPCSLYKSL